MPSLDLVTAHFELHLVNPLDLLQLVDVVAHITQALDLAS